MLPTTYYVGDDGIANQKFILEYWFKGAADVLPSAAQKRWDYFFFRVKWKYTPLIEAIGFCASNSP